MIEVLQAGETNEERRTRCPPSPQPTVHPRPLTDALVKHLPVANLLLVAGEERVAPPGGSGGGAGAGGDEAVVVPGHVLRQWVP